MPNDAAVTGDDPAAPELEPTVIDHPMARLGGGALVVRRGGRAWIVVDPDLSPPARRAAITHEIVHLRRGLPPARDFPDAWDAVVAREERHVDLDVAHLLVPPGELATAIAQWLASQQPVTASLVAEAFDTTPKIAALALASLATRTQAVGRPSRNVVSAPHHEAGASN